MGSGEWVDTPGAVGEMPIEIQEHDDAAFVIDFAEGVRIGSYSAPCGTSLVPGDVCIITAEVMDEDRTTKPTEIAVDIREIDEFVRRGETVDASGGPADTQDTSEIAALMDHLESAKERHRERETEKGCENCRTIDSDTSLSIETTVGSRDLHYCKTCERLVSTPEYEHWKSLHRV